MTSIDAPICVYCARLLPAEVGKWGLFCQAFPDGDGIPETILLSQIDHRTHAVAGDHGLRYKAKSPTAEAAAARIIATAKERR